MYKSSEAASAHSCIFFIKLRLPFLFIYFQNAISILSVIRGLFLGDVMFVFFNLLLLFRKLQEHIPKKGRNVEVSSVLIKQYKATCYILFNSASNSYQ